MSASSKLLELAEDVVFMSARDWRASVRANLDCEAGDWMGYRSSGRAASIVVDAELKALIHEFSAPSTVRDAVASYCRTREVDSTQVLTEAEPAIARLLRLGYLRDSSKVESSSKTSFLEQAKLSGWSDAALVQDLDGALVFKAKSKGRPVAIKIGQQQELGFRGLSTIEREADTLRRLPAKLTPELLDAGRFNDRDYIVLEWIDGTDALRRSHLLRRDERECLGQLCADIIGCFSSLERAGWLHGDVHPRNIIVDATNRPRLVDFGEARRINATSAKPIARAGIAYFFDPQHANALLLHERAPAYGVPSEQFSLAALTYLLLCGHHYQDFSLERAQLLGQIVAGGMKSFAARGLQSQSRIEAVLQRALHKDPESRFPCIAEFEREFREALRLSNEGRARDRAQMRQRASSLSELAYKTERYRDTRTEDAAFHDGSAGIAYAQYRIALLRDSPRLLASSEIWIARARNLFARLERGRGSVEGTTSFPTPVGSLHHSETGVHCVDALIAIAGADPGRASRSIQAFVDSIPEDLGAADVTHGQAGALVGCALLLEQVPSHYPAPVRQVLVERGMRVAAGLRRLDCDLESTMAPGIFPGGIAHGLAGRIYAALRWSEASHAPADTAHLDALEQASTRPSRRPMRDGGRSKARGFMRASWCNGASGHVFLMLLAARQSRRDGLMRLALNAARFAWADKDGSPCLCCGLAGRAYAMLATHRATGDRVWLERANLLSLRAAANADRLGPGLYKGAAGIELLRTELKDPRRARMPLFE